MTTNFETLKQNRKSNFDKLTSELNKLNNNVSQNNTNSSIDDRFWKPDVDKAGNGYAIIRFLPAPSGEDVPFIRIWDHGFQGAGGWYIEKSLTTLNKPDPVTEMNTKLWNSGVESNKELVRKYKRRLSFYSNILIVSDPSHPENNGKVMLFKYGKKIFDKLNEAMHPQFADERPINPFDFWDGANFKLKIRQVEGYRNYDKSELETSTPIANDDNQIKAIWSKQHSLQELLDPKHFKSYEELRMRLEKALGAAKDSAQRIAPSIDEDETFPIPQRSTASPSIPSAKQESAPWNEDDDDLSFFKKLASS